MTATAKKPRDIELEVELVRRHREGDRRATQQFFELYDTRLRQLARHRSFKFAQKTGLSQRESFDELYQIAWIETMRLLEPGRSFDPRLGGLITSLAMTINRPIAEAINSYQTGAGVDRPKTQVTAVIRKHLFQYVKEKRAKQPDFNLSHLQNPDFEEIARRSTYGNATTPQISTVKAVLETLSHRTQSAVVNEGEERDIFDIVPSEESTSEEYELEAKRQAFLRGANEVKADIEKVLADPKSSVAQASSATKQLRVLEDRVLLAFSTAATQKTLQEVSEVFDISRERVRQIERAVLEKIKKKVMAFV